jgi:hypothetical protein
MIEMGMLFNVDYPNVFIIYNDRHEPVAVAASEAIGYALIEEFKADASTPPSGYRLVGVSYKS